MYTSVFVAPVKCGVLTLVGEIRRYRNMTDIIIIINIIIIRL